VQSSRCTSSGSPAVFPLVGFYPAAADGPLHFVVLGNRDVYRRPLESDDIVLTQAVPSVYSVHIAILAVTLVGHYIIHMLFLILRTFISALRSHRALALENLALRHQLEVLNRNSKRPRLTNQDRILWSIFSGLWTGWRKSLIVVQPDTVIRWHRRGFQFYWRWRSRPRWSGRRRVPLEIRNLIRSMMTRSWFFTHIALHYCCLTNIFSLDNTMITIIIIC